MTKMLQEVMALTEDGGERRRDYDHPLINFLNTCIRWQLDGIRDASPYKMSFMMDSLKSARDKNVAKEDNQVDKVGYMNCLAMMQEKLIEMNYCETLAEANITLSNTNIVHMARLYEMVEAFEQMKDDDRVIEEVAEEKVDCEIGFYFVTPCDVDDGSIT